jgi:nucleoside-diphosphate-sugar epimerase
MSKILVTGGSGFIGTNLVEHFHLRGDTVLNLDISPPRNPLHRSFWRESSMLDPDALDEAVRTFDPEYIVHMAARTDLLGFTVDDYRANTDGVANLIAVARRLTGLKRIVFASSMLVCKVGYRPRSATDYCPTTAYGESKVCFEKIISRDAGDLPWVIVRPTSIWGPWFDIPYKDFFTAVRRGLYVHPRGRRIRRSYGFVGNTVAQLARLLYAPPEQVESKTFYLADYEPIELKSWATTIQQAFGAPRVREVPLALLRCGARIGDFLSACGYRKPPLTTFRLANLLTDAIHDLKPLEEVCGPAPYTIEEGVARTADWMKQGLK